MNRLLKMLDPVKSLFTDSKHNSASQCYDFDDTINQIIDSIDPRLRLVPGHKAKLRSAVHQSINHISQLVNQLPDSVVMTRESFLNNPVVRAYFSSPDAMQNVFSCGGELDDYFCKHPDAKVCYALLCVNKQEKSIVGSAMVDGVVTKEVLQQTISFYDHKLMSPAESDEAVRRGIKQCILDGLVTHALQHITSIRSERRELQDQRRILNSQLRSRQRNSGGLTELLSLTTIDAEASRNITNKLNKAENRLRSMLNKRDILSFYLNEIIEILSHPEKFIRLDKSCFRLNDMGVVVDPNDNASSNTVCFSELEINQVLKRVVTVVCYDKDDLDCKSPGVVF